MVSSIVRQDIEDILYGDAGKYAHLFPFRDRVPQVSSHIFEDMFSHEKSIDRFVVRTMMDIDYIGWTCRAILGLELFPLQVSMLRLIWRSPFPLLVAARGSGKTFLLAVYAILRALIDQGTKIVIVGAGLRQAKLVFNYIDTLWKSSPVLRSICGGAKFGPKHNVDACRFNIGDSTIVALPLGDGCLSSNTLLTYEDGIGYIDEDQPRYLEEKNIIKRSRNIFGNGKFNNSDESYCNGVKPTKIVRTSKGFEFEGTLNHRMRVCQDGAVKWVETRDMRVGDRVLIDRSIRWHKGKEEVTDNQAYALGLMIGDGNWNGSSRLGFATKDKELINAVRAGTGFEFLQCKNDDVHYVEQDFRNRDKWLDFWGLTNACSHEKELPRKILRADLSNMRYCLMGIFDSDGSLQVSTKKGGTSICISLTTTSEKLAKQIHFILLHYGITSFLGHRDRSLGRWRRIYELLITGKDVKRFVDRIGFKLTRKKDKANYGLKRKAVDRSLGDSVFCVQEDMVGIAIEYNYPGSPSIFPSSIKKKRSITHDFIDRFLAIYGHIKDDRIDLIRTLGNRDIYYDEIVSMDDSKCNTFDLHVPKTHEYCANGFYSHNSKIRGFRANVIIADEFGSIPPDIFDVVVRGFAATSRSPVEEARRIATKRQLDKMNLNEGTLRKLLKDKVDGNQIIISGTAYYAFNHFAKRFNMWRNIINSCGNMGKIAEIFGSESAIPDNFDWKDYLVLQIPHTHVQEGLLDSKQLANAKAMLPKSIFDMEYSAIFVADSDGFFPRSLIEQCTPTPSYPIQTPDGPVIFTPSMIGENKSRYVIGVDPAAERDNFGLVILELCGNTYRVVHCWSVNKKEFEKRKKAGLLTNDDYYAYCCHKIREFERSFRPLRIEMDSQGGGYAIAEMLRNDKLVGDDQKPIYEVIDMENTTSFDLKRDGPHILHLVKQTSEWNSESNRLLHKSLETRCLLFPAFNPIKIEASLRLEGSIGKTIDTFEDCTADIEELKNELCNIQMTVTATGREHFDTPTTIAPGAVEGRKRTGKLKKDRYSALLFAHRYAYEVDVRAVPKEDYNDVAGNISIVQSDPSLGMYRGLGVAAMQNNQWVRGSGGGAAKGGERVG